MRSALAPPHSLCPLRFRGKKVPFETFVDDSPGQEAYDTPEISRIYLFAYLCHIQCDSRHPSKVRNVLYRIFIFYSWLIGLLGSFSRHFDLLSLSLHRREVSSE